MYYFIIIHKLRQLTYFSINPWYMCFNFKFIVNFHIFSNLKTICYNSEIVKLIKKIEICPTLPLEWLHFISTPGPLPEVGELEGSVQYLICS